MTKEEKIRLCIVGPGINNLQIRSLIKKYRFTTIIIAGEENIITSKGLDCKVIKHYWNESNPTNLMQVKSLSFEVFESLSHDYYASTLASLFGDPNKEEMFEQLAKKIYVETYAEILKAFAMASEYSSIENEVTLVLPKKYEKCSNDIQSFLKKNNDMQKCKFPFQSKLKVIYKGMPILNSLVNYLYSLAIPFFFFISIRKVCRSHNVKKYKIGLLSWNSSLLPSESRNESEGLDAVIPNTIDSEDVLIYSKDEIKAKNKEIYSRSSFSKVSWQRWDIYKTASFSEIYFLLNIFLRLLVFPSSYINAIYKPLQVNLPKIIYDYLRWKKFINQFRFDISISYNDYSSGDLIRNFIFMDAGISCWGYIHTCTDYYLFDSSQKIYDPIKSFNKYDLRFYLLPHQLDIHTGSKIISKKNIIVGPLFREYKSKIMLPSKLSKKKIIGVFPCSIGSKVIHPEISHKAFFRDIFSLIEESYDDSLFLVKVKGGFDAKVYSKFFDPEIAEEYIKKNKLLFFGEEAETGKLIRVSQGVISMAFSSPTIESIASDKDGIFYDPAELFPNNRYASIQDLYLTKREELFDYYYSIYNVSRDLKDSLQNKKDSLGITNEMNGVKEIHNEINNLLYL